VLTGALDYRGERLRVTGDVGHQQLNCSRATTGFGVLPGFTIPAARGPPSTRHSPGRPSSSKACSASRGRSTT